MMHGALVSSIGRDLAWTAPSPAGPLLAVVIPVYKHSVLLEEAVVSVLNQETDFEICIVIVNDGCPMAETHRACLDFAAAANRIHYIRRPNGGLSAARNTGIDYVLGAWETVRAIYFLDADNRLLPDALQSGYDALAEDPQAAWIYPDIDMFGQEWNSDYSGEYSVLRHLDENICEAGSLVRREVFEKGARFDESMRLGFEDWDFWLGAIELGFRGKHLKNFGFRYRRRPESMLSNSERDRPEITAYIRRKHKNLFCCKTLIAFEHTEAPRYAIHILGSGTVSLASDPLADGQVLTLKDFFAQYYRSRMAPTRYARAPFLFVIDSSFREILTKYSLLQWAFWLLESAIETCNFAYLIGQPHPEPERIEVNDISGNAHDNAHHAAGLVMMHADLLDACLDDPADSWIMSLGSSAPQPRIRILQLLLPECDQDESSLRANPGMLDLVHQMRQFRATVCNGQPWNWRQSHLTARAALYRVARNILGADPVYPRVVGGGRKQIGFVVPLAEFGGVEKTAYNLARVMRANGWSTHLFVFAAQTARPASVVVEAFDSVNFLCDPEVGQWDPQNRFMGSHYPSWVTAGRHSRALGLLCGLDAVVNFHCAEAHALMAPLRRQGTKTIASLHVTDLTPLDRPSGHTYLTVGYEHAYDLFACCSRQLLDWCHAMGIPEGKLALLWNAPSYELADSVVQQALAARQERDRHELRVLVMGRLDRQKGLDRLTAIARSCRDADLPIEWRLIGASIIGDAGQSELEHLAIEIEPPRLGPDALTECYAWADVVLMVSRWEGLPLTILEAMRLGAVVCATAVGSVPEAIVHNDTGFLLPSRGTAEIAREAVRTLHDLSGNWTLLQRISSAAAAASRAWTWENSASDFLERLGRLHRDESARQL
jgi:glycosyltransferase involved in cell wall biosynthesis